MLSLWLFWRRGEVILSSMISLVITGGFLVTFSLQNTYGGAMKYLDGSENTLLGLNLGVVGFGLVVALLVLNVLLELGKSKNTQQKNQSGDSGVM